ncbi:MAG: helix-turn-helix domain-containing protein [Pseudonocardia sp.]
MTLSFRNIAVSPNDPVENWPTEAVLTALERGGLSHWRRLAAAIRNDPWGPVARIVEEALTLSEAYGVNELMADAIAGARARAGRAERAAVAAEITRRVAASGLSRAEFASRIGTSCSRLSTYLAGTVTPSAALLVRMRRVSGIGSPHPLPGASAQAPFGSEVRSASSGKDTLEHRPDNIVR